MIKVEGQPPVEEALAEWPRASEQDRADFEYERYKERKADRDAEAEQLYGR